MPSVDDLAARLEKRKAALEQQKELLARNSTRRKTSGGPMEVVSLKQAPPSAPQPKVAAVRMHGDPILSLAVPWPNGPQHLSVALRQCVEAYLEAAQCGTRKVLLIWPGSIECLPLIHAIATIECWAQGYKLGLRSITYPATNATFWPLNHVFVDREDVHVMNNEVREVSYEGKNPAVKEGCEKKDLMLFALNSLKTEAKSAGLQPCLNELLPNYHLETGEKSEVLAQNYCNIYLSHLVTKLTKRGHTKELREKTLPALGAPQVAPDASFALSYRMTKRQIEQALQTLKGLGRVNVVLLDATRSAFERTEKLASRIAVVVRLVGEVFGDGGPGIVIVTNDPRQMTQLRAAMTKEAQGHNTNFRFGPTHALCHSEQNLGLQAAVTEPLRSFADVNISVEITDRESARLINQAYRLGREITRWETAIAALTAASKFVRTMANLPSSANLLYEWLDEITADDAQRRHFDWVAHRNRLKASLSDIPVNVRAGILAWSAQADAIIELQAAGTPLARAMLSRIKLRAEQGGRVLVVVASRFYAGLANDYLLRDPDAERYVDCVRFTGIKLLQAQLATGWPNRLVVCALSPDLLRWLVTSNDLPGPVDFLLTQETALGARYALEPVLGFPAFEPYFPRVKALYDPIKHAQFAVSAVMPDNDYQAPSFSLTPSPVAGSSGAGERGPSDYVEIEIEGGRRIYRGRGARVYVYDPAARESRTLGFRPVSAEGIKKGDQIFVMSEDMREQAEEAFAQAGVTFDEASKYEKLLRQYHTQVLQRVAERYPGNVADAARAIRDAILKAHADLATESSNVRNWINLKDAEKTPYDQLMPQAPRHFETFRAFMEALGFDATNIEIFWHGAVKKVRGTRISDGLNLGEHYDRVLFDPDGAATYDRLTSDVLDSLRAVSLDNVYEVTAVTYSIITRD